jgi:hypothetical protein
MQMAAASSLRGRGPTLVFSNSGASPRCGADAARQALVKTEARELRNAIDHPRSHNRAKAGLWSLNNFSPAISWHWARSAGFVCRSAFRVTPWGIGGVDYWPATSHILWHRNLVAFRRRGDVQFARPVRDWHPVAPSLSRLRTQRRGTIRTRAADSQAGGRASRSHLHGRTATISERASQHPWLRVSRHIRVVPRTRWGCRQLAGRRSARPVGAGTSDIGSGHSLRALLARHSSPNRRAGRGRCPLIVPS